VAMKKTKFQHQGNEGKKKVKACGRRDLTTEKRARAGEQHVGLVERGKGNVKSSKGRPRGIAQSSGAPRKGWRKAGDDPFSQGGGAERAWVIP